MQFRIEELVSGEKHDYTIFPSLEDNLTFHMNHTLCLNSAVSFMALSLSTFVLFVSSFIVKYCYIIFILYYFL